MIRQCPAPVYEEIGEKGRMNVEVASVSQFPHVHSLFIISPCLETKFTCEPAGSGDNVQALKFSSKHMKDPLHMPV